MREDRPWVDFQKSAPMHSGAKKPIHWPLIQRGVKNSHGSVAEYVIRCGEISNTDFITNLYGQVSQGKEFRKLVRICRSYRQDYSGTLFTQWPMNRFLDHPISL